MINDKTLHLELPLPHKDNKLSEDVSRLRQALTALDAYSAMLHAAVGDAAAQAAAPVAASRITGVLDLANIPMAALEDMIDVPDDAARYALTAAQVHIGKTVRVLSGNPPKLYIVVDLSNLGNAAGYKEYAMVVRWEAIEDKPIDATPTEGNLVVYGEGGTVSTSAPVASEDAANKGYVDSAFLDYFLAWHIFKGIHPDAKPGMVPVTGTLIEDAVTKYPQAWAYLLSTAGQKLCTTEALWQAASAAKTYTLADGTQIGWDGIGGVCKYVIDTNAGTIRVPDLRGMYEEVSGYDSLDVGGVHGDGMRNIIGAVSPRGGLSPTSITGPFYSTGEAGAAELSATTLPYTIRFDASRVVPTANKFQPRAWGALACVYLGKQYS